MEETRIVVVDDSAFSVMYIRNILESNGFDVVGDAGTLENVIKVVKEKRPTLVTMDITLPGTDGFECTRAIHEIDKNIKVIIISSMMDDEVLSKAKKSRVSAFIQKPIDADELITVVKRVTAAEELYALLQDEYFAAFKESLLDGLNKMTKNLITYSSEYTSSEDYESLGISVIIGIIGKFSGRMLIDISKTTANNIAQFLYKKTPDSSDEINEMLGEFANIIAGNACSVLNKKNKALGLRVAPPSILTGDNVQILAPNFSTKSVKGQSAFGELMLNVGFTKDGSEWM